MQEQKMNIYEIVQDQMLLKLKNAIEGGEKFEWIKPWTGTRYPCSYAKPEKPFGSPVNFLFLEPGEYLTWNQIIKLREENPAVKIKKGAKQAYVFQSYPIFRKDENGKNITDETGEPVIESFRLRYSREFHISDVEGVKSHFVPTEHEHQQSEITQMADELIRTYCQKYGIEFLEIYGNGRAYTQGNKIVVPSKVQYEELGEYYSTIFHEIGHSTKLVNKREKKSYAQEELVAELTAAFLCSSIGLSTGTTERNSIAYLQSWYGQIKETNARDLYFSIGEAKKASDLVLNGCPKIRKQLEPVIQKENMEKIKYEAEKKPERKTNGTRK